LPEEPFKYLHQTAALLAGVGLGVLHNVKDGVAFADRRAGSRFLLDHDPVAIEYLHSVGSRSVNALGVEDPVVLDLVLSFLKTHTYNLWHEPILWVVTAEGIEAVVIWI